MNYGLHKGDCLEIMKSIPDKSVDMILCDLPYGITRNKWDAKIPLQPMWAQYERIIKGNCAIVLTASQPFTTELVVSNRKLFKYSLVWKKSAATGFLNANRMPLRSHEDILVFYKSLPTYSPQFWYGKPYTAKRHAATTNYGGQKERTVTVSADGKRFPLSVIDIPTKRRKGGHPTEKPVELMEYLIKTYTNPGETVLDNCMGSGSTGVACANTGRKFIGIEIDAGYFATAEKRIMEAQKVENDRI